MMMNHKIPIGGGEAVFMKAGDEAIGCEIHDWPDEGLPKRLIDAMRKRHNKGGLNVCRNCLERARAVAKTNIEAR